MWSLSTVALAVLWYGLAVGNQLLVAHLQLDYYTVPWCVAASALLVYGLTWLHELLPRGWTPASPAPRMKARTMQYRSQDEDRFGLDDTESGGGGGAVGPLGGCADIETDQIEGRRAETVSLLLASAENTCTVELDLTPTSALAASSTAPSSSPATGSNAATSTSLSVGSELAGLREETVALLAAAVCHLFYHCTLLLAGLWIGDLSIVLIWRAWEPLLLHIIHTKQLTTPDAVQGAMLLYLLVRWDKPSDSDDPAKWLMQRGLVVLGSAALCCCNHIVHGRWQSSEVGRTLFRRLSTYVLLLSLPLWLASALVAPFGSLLRLVGLSFPLLSLCTALSVFVGWLLLTQCSSLELYSALLMARRGVMMNGVYLLVVWRQVQALLIVASVTASSAIECSKLSSQRRWSLLPLLLVCLTAIVQRAFELPHSHSALPLIPVDLQQPRHIAVISAAGNGNLGDNVQIDAWRNHFDSWTERSGVPVVLHSWSRELCCSSYDETLKHFLPSDPTGLTHLLKSTPPLDWIWIGGGGLLSCPHAPLNDADPAWQYQLLQRAELSRTRVAFMGVGAREPELVSLVHPLLESAAYIGVRDTLSREVVKAAHVNRTHISIMHDPVLAMQPPVLALSPTRRDAARVPTCWILMGDWQFNPTISLLVDSFFQPGDDLLITMEAKDGNFYGRFNPDFVRLHDRDMMAFMHSLSHCDFVVSMRFHGSIIASVLGIPSLGIDLTGNSTTLGKMSVLYSPVELDRPDCVLYPNLANLTFIEVKTMHNKCRRHVGAREHLHKRMGVIRSEFREQFDLVMSM